MHMEKKRHIALADDHKLLRQGLKSLVESLGPSYKIIYEADNGQQLLSLLVSKELPDLIILDLDMPVMDGFETAEVLSKKHPEIPVLVLTVLKGEDSLIRMLRTGIKGYLRKDMDSDVLCLGINSIFSYGYFYSDVVTGSLLKVIDNDNHLSDGQRISDRERTFLTLCCSEYTYKEIAEQMFLSPKTIDGYRASLFEKMEVTSRVGLVLKGIKQGLVKI